MIVLTVVQGSLENIEDKVRVKGLDDALAHYEPSVDIEHERHMQPALLGRDIGDVPHSES